MTGAEVAAGGGIVGSTKSGGLGGGREADGGGPSASLDCDAADCAEVTRLRCVGTVSSNCGGDSCGLGRERRELWTQKEKWARVLSRFVRWS